MEKVKLLLKISLALLALGMIALCVLLYVESGETEKIYQNTLKYIKSSQWDEAAESIEKIPNYKDIPELYIYVYPNSIYNSSYNSNEEKSKAYNAIINYIEGNKDKLKGENTKKYTSELLGLENTIRFKLAMESLREKNDEALKGLDECVSLIKLGDFVNARDKLNNLGDSIITRVDRQQLLEYVNLIDAIGIKNNDAIMKTIVNLDPNYNGPLSAEIKTAVQPYADIIKWNDMYAGIKDRVALIQITPGVEREYAILKLGNPQKTNRTTSSYGDFEEMIYENGVHIFIQEDNVYAIKE